MLPKDAAYSLNEVSIGTLGEMAGDYFGTSTNADRLRAAVTAGELKAGPGESVSRDALRKYLAQVPTHNKPGPWLGWATTKPPAGAAEAVVLDNEIGVQQERVNRLPDLINAMSRANNLKELQAAQTAAETVLKEAESARDKLDRSIEQAEQRGIGLLRGNVMGINALRQKFRTAFGDRFAYLDSLR